MRIAHTADLQLGRLFGSDREVNGVGVRQRDLALLFRLFVDQAIAADVDLALLAGDIFDGPRPYNRTIEFLFGELMRLSRVCPVVMVGGNHDRPHSATTGHPLHLYRRIPNVFVASMLRERFDFPELDCSVLAVPEPDVLRPQHPAMEPEGSARHQILLLHSAVSGIGPAKGIKPAELHPGFGYIALGDFHELAQVAPNAWYSGSLGYASSDIWGELRHEAERGEPGKCWLLADLEAGSVAPQWMPSFRRHADLPVIDAMEMSEADVAAAMEANAGDVTDAVIRQVILNCHRTMDREVRRMELKLKRTAVEYQAAPRRPEVRSAPASIEEPEEPEEPGYFVATNEEGTESHILGDQSEWTGPFASRDDLDYDGQPIAALPQFRGHAA